MAWAEEEVFNKLKFKRAEHQRRERGHEKAVGTVVQLSPWSVESDADWSARYSETGQFAPPVSSSLSSMSNGNNKMNCMIGCL